MNNKNYKLIVFIFYFFLVAKALMALPLGRIIIFALNLDGEKELT